MELAVEGHQNQKREMKGRRGNAEVSGEDERVMSRAKTSSALRDF